MGFDGTASATTLVLNQDRLSKILKATFEGSNLIIQVPIEFLSVSTGFVILILDVKGRIVAKLSSDQIRNGELRWNVPKSLQGKLLWLSFQGLTEAHTQRILVPMNF